jgi:acyl-CoA thioester hydrolase
MDSYSMNYNIRWADLDANGHVNYAAYIDATADLRYRYFAEHGYPQTKFLEMGIGPVYTSLRAQFLREVRYGEKVTITFMIAGISPTGMRWRARHDVLKENGKLAVEIELEGTILDMSSRRPVRPAPELLAVFDQLPHHKTFEKMPELRRAAQ